MLGKPTPQSIHATLYNGEAHVLGTESESGYCVRCSGGVPAFPPMHTVQHVVWGSVVPHGEILTACDP